MGTIQDKTVGFTGRVNKEVCLKSEWMQNMLLSKSFKFLKAQLARGFVCGQTNEQGHANKSLLGCS